MIATRSRRRLSGLRDGTDQRLVGEGPDDARPGDGRSLADAARAVAALVRDVSAVQPHGPAAAVDVGPGQEEDHASFESLGGEIFGVHLIVTSVAHTAV